MAVYDQAEAQEYPVRWAFATEYHRGSTLLLRSARCAQGVAERRVEVAEADVETQYNRLIRETGGCLRNCWPDSNGAVLRKPIGNERLQTIITGKKMPEPPAVTMSCASLRRFRV